MSKRTKTSISIECIFGEIQLVIGDIKVDLSLNQTRELSDLLNEAAEHADRFVEDEEVEP